MNEISGMIASPGWWFSTIAVALMVNIFSTLVCDKLKSRAGELTFHNVLRALSITHIAAGILSAICAAIYPPDGATGSLVSMVLFSSAITAILQLKVLTNNSNYALGNGLLLLFLLLWLTAKSTSDVDFWVVAMGYWMLSQMAFAPIMVFWAIRTALTFYKKPSPQ